MNGVVPEFIRISLAGVILFCGWYLARGGVKAVFGTARDKPEVIKTGVFRVVRHPIYFRLSTEHFRLSTQALKAYLNKLAMVGFWPWTRMAVLNTRAPIHTVNIVKRITPTNPTIGCHIGMVTDEASLISITDGVNGGINARVVASGPVGS